MIKIRSDKERIWEKDKDGGWHKPQSTHRYPLLPTIVVSILFVLFVFWFWYTISRPAGAVAPPPFDHNLCQYPDRTTNPAYGCDNSDPCDPATTKFGSGACLPQQPTLKTDVITQLDHENVMSHNIEIPGLK